MSRTYVALIGLALNGCGSAQPTPSPNLVPDSADDTGQNARVDNSASASNECDALEQWPALLMRVIDESAQTRTALEREVRLDEATISQLLSLVARARRRQNLEQEVQYLTANARLYASDENDAGARIERLNAELAGIEPFTLEPLATLMSHTTQTALCHWTLQRLNALEAARPPLELRANNYTRPYGPRAPWNVLVRHLPRHARSKHYARLLYENASVRPGEFFLNFAEYTYPVYRVTPETPLYAIRLTKNWGSNLVNQSIPWNSAWQPNSGSDGQIILLDPATGREWNLWQVTFENAQVVAANGNLVPGSYWTRETGFTGSRGAGIPYYAMLVTPEEIQRGVIEHALSMPIRNTSGKEYVAPATKLEFPKHPAGVPEGMRFALDVKDGDIDEWVTYGLPEEVPVAHRRLTRIVLTALRDYGWFITDTSGAAHLQFEAPETAQADWEQLGILPKLTPDPNNPWHSFPRKLVVGFITPERIIALVPSDRYPSELRARPAIEPP